MVKPGPYFKYVSSSEQPVHCDTPIVWVQGLQFPNEEIADFKMCLHRTKANAKTTSVQMIFTGQTYHK